MKSSFLIGIAGGTGSGKSTFVEKIKNTISPTHINVISQDSYYKDLSHLPIAERGARNFDHPDSFDTNLLAKQIEQLKSGKKIKMPVYDFRTHTRDSKTVTLSPRPVIILEGIMCYEDLRIDRIMDLKIFVDVPGEIRLIRRIYRDIKKRGRTLQSVTDQYQNTVWPMYFKYVAPQKDRADIIVTKGGKNQPASDLIATKIRSLVDF